MKVMRYEAWLGKLWDYYFKNNTYKIGFPFAKLLRNFCGTKRKIFLSLRFSFARKNSNLRNHSQKAFRAKLPYSAFSQLEFCEIPQFRYNHMCVFLGIERFFAGICILEESGFGMSYYHFNPLQHIRPMTVKMSSNLMGAHLIH